MSSGAAGGSRSSTSTARASTSCCCSRSPRPARTMRTDRPAGDDASPPRPPGTRALLALLAAGDPDETIRFCDVFAGLGERAFGMLLFVRSEEHTSELQSLMRISYAVFCLKKKNKH